MQNYKKSFTSYAKRNFKILNETKQIHKEKNHFSKAEIKERSILFILLNYLESTKNKLGELLEINFTIEELDDIRR